MSEKVNHIKTSVKFSSEEKMHRAMMTVDDWLETAAIFEALVSLEIDDGITNVFEGIGNRIDSLEDVLYQTFNSGEILKRAEITKLYTEKMKSIKGK